MSQIEGNNSVLSDMRSRTQEEPEPNIKYEIDHEQEQVNVNDFFDSLPENIKEFINKDVSSLDDLIKALQYLQHPLLSASLSQSDLDAVQALIKQLSVALAQSKEQLKLDNSAKSLNADVKLQMDLSEQLPSKLGKSDSFLTNIEDPVLLKNMALTAEQLNTLNKQGVPVSLNDNAKAFLTAYANEIKALQLLAETGTKITINGQVVSVYGVQGVLSAENIAGFIARGDQAFLDNARVAAANEGYNTLDMQQESNERNGRQGSDDNKQDSDTDTLFFYEDDE